MEQRFKSPALASSLHSYSIYGNSLSYTTLYVAYYDYIRNQIIFKYGTVDTSKRDSYDQLYSNGNPNGGDGRAFVVDQKYWSVLAGDGAPKSAGEYLDIAVVQGTTQGTFNQDATPKLSNNDVVCAVWYDGANLQYSYKINPCNDNDANTTNTGAGYWNTPEQLITNGGQYCKIETDANGGIHIAAYDQANKSVDYIYKPTYSGQSTKIIVDALNGPYDEIGLDVAVDNIGSTGKAYPTISYYANGTPKMATYSTGIVKTTGVPEASWENNAFNGKWDVCYVPTTSDLLKDHTNVAQPKNSSGVIERVTNTTAGEATGSFETVGLTDNGTVSGKPILGYAIRSGAVGYLEIAQRK